VEPWGSNGLDEMAGNAKHIKRKPDSAPFIPFYLFVGEWE